MTRPSRSTPATREKSDARLLRGEKTRLVLIQTASTHFGLYGYERASLREIAQESELPFQLITYHFGSKEALWKTVVETLFGRAIAQVRSLASDGASNADERVRNWISEMLTFCADEPMLRKILLREHFENGPRYLKIIKPRLRDLMKEFSAAFQKVYALAGKSPLTVLEAQLLFQAYFATISLGRVQVSYPGKKPGARRWIETHTEFLVNLLKHGRGTSSRP